MPEEIGHVEVQHLIAAGAYLLDVREREGYDAEHLPGAVSLPIKSLDRETTALGGWRGRPGQVVRLSTSGTGRPGPGRTPPGRPAAARSSWCGTSVGSSHVIGYWERWAASLRPCRWIRRASSSSDHTGPLHSLWVPPGYHPKGYRGQPTDPPGRL